MRRHCIALGALAVILMAGSASAQSQNGLGVAIPDDKLAAGTVVVRVVNGVMSRPLSALEVSMVDEASGKELVVRTGPDGRAPFRGLAPGSRYTAFIKVGDKENASQPLQIPQAGGIRVLLSPIPLRAEPAAGSTGQGGAAAGPHGGAATGGPGGLGGMPDPRMMSGRARPEQKDPPGQLTVRTLQGKFRIDEIAGRVADHPEDAVVTLISFASDGTISVRPEKVDEQGRVTFKRLKTNNSVSYWVFSSFARGSNVDRLQSQVISMLPQVGMRLMLAGLAPDSTEPGVDDISEIRNGAKAPRAGDVVVELTWDPKRVGEVELVELESGRVAGTSPTKVESRRGPVASRFGEAELDAALRDGVLQIRVGGPNGPLAGAQVSVVALDGEGKPTAEVLGAARATDAKGEVTFDSLPPSRSVRIDVEAVGERAASKPIVVPAKGGVRVGAAFLWRESQPSVLAGFSAVKPGFYIVRGKDKDATYYSSPFQMVADRGVYTRMFVAPHLLFQFSSEAQIDDDKLGFHFRFSVANPSVFPLDTGKEGLLIPLPKGFGGAGVADEMATRIRVDDHGFVWRGAFPAGQRNVTGGFYLPVDDGTVEYELPLPYGTIESSLAFQDLPGMELNLPSSAKRESLTAPNGKIFTMIKGITIQSGRTLKLSVKGLPGPPRWKRWMPLIAGFGVLALLLWGFASIFIYRSQGAIGAREQLEQQREELLSRLVVLDDKLAKQTSKKRSHTAKSLLAQRSKLMGELEDIYSQLDGSA